MLQTAREVMKPNTQNNNNNQNQPTNTNTNNSNSNHVMNNYGFALPNTNTMPVTQVPSFIPDFLNTTTSSVPDDPSALQEVIFRMITKNQELIFDR